MKKFLVFLLSLTICLTPSLTFAGLSSSGWSVSNPVASGASTVYTGTKQLVINGADYIKKGTAKITPTASRVAKLLGKGVAGVALSVAIQEMLGAVDWVLDPENNQIKYYETNEIEKGFGFGCSGSSATSTLQTILNTCNASLGMTDVKITANGQKTLNNTMSSMQIGNNKTLEVEVSVARPNDTPAIVTMIIVVQKLGEVEQEEKYLPLPVVAQKVISNAESGDANAQAATTAAAADIVAEAETDQTGVKARPIVNQLENSSTTKPADEAAADKANEATGEQTKNPDKPDTTDLKLTFPIFCNWAPQVCEAAQVVISLPRTLTNWWETSKQKTDSWAKSISDAYASTKEWFQKEPDKDNSDNDVPVKTPEAFDNSVFSKDRFAVSRQCPIPEQHTISLSGVSVNFSFDMTPLCQVLILARPALVACSYLYAAYIVIGAARNG